jgi:hypothetical protein
MKRDSIVLNDQITSVSTDNKGNFYVGTASGRMARYDSTCQLLENYAFPNQSAITLIEAQNRLRLFLFKRDNQSVTILDRFSAIPKTYWLSNFGIDYGLMACPSVDNNLWVIENNPQVLSKIDLLKNEKILQLQIELGDSISFMRAVQNILLVASEDGTYLIDQFGEPLARYDARRLNHIQVSNDWIGIHEQDTLRIINLFYPDNEKKFRVPSGLTYAIFLTENTLLGISNNRIFTYSNNR